MDCRYGRRYAARRSYAPTLASTAIVLRLCLALASRVPASSGKICRHFGYCSPYHQRRFFDTIKEKKNAGKTGQINAGVFLLLVAPANRHPDFICQEGIKS
jgi:hypothetical protein